MYKIRNEYIRCKQILEKHRYFPVDICLSMYMLSCSIYKKMVIYVNIIQKNKKNLAMLVYSVVPARFNFNITTTKIGRVKYLVTLRP